MGDISIYRWIILGVIGMTAVIKIGYQVYNRRYGVVDIRRNWFGRSRVRKTSGVNEFGPVNYYANDRHNRKDKWFQFQYKKVGDEWLTYILRMPSLEGRDGNLHFTHRYRRGSTYWICYDPQPKTLKDAQSISRAWADRELEYIATGTHFENQRW